MAAGGSERRAGLLCGRGAARETGIAQPQGRKGRARVSLPRALRLFAQRDNADVATGGRWEDFAARPGPGRVKPHTSNPQFNRRIADRKGAAFGGSGGGGAAGGANTFVTDSRDEMRENLRRDGAEMMARANVFDGASDRFVAALAAGDEFASWDQVGATKNFSHGGSLG